MLDDEDKEVGQCALLPAQAPKTSTANYGHVGGQYFDKLASLAWPSQVVPCTRVRMAALLSQMLSPVEFIKDGKAALIKENDLNRLTAKKSIEAVVEVEEMLDTARAWLDELQIVGRPRLLLLAEHDCRMVNFLLKKNKETLEHTEYKDAGTAFQVFVDALTASTGQAIDNPWAPGRRHDGKKPEQALWTTILFS